MAAVCLGAELQTLTEQYGPDAAVSGVVPQVLRVLELLESYVGGSGRERGCTEEEMLIRAVHSISRSSCLKLRRKSMFYRISCRSSHEENQKLLGQLAERKSKEDFCASDTIPTSGTWHPEKDDTFACGDKTGNVSLVNLKNPNSAQTSAVHSQSITGLAYSFHMYHLYFAFFSVCVVIL
ncbi:methylosome protein 50-like [Xenopus laevis]|uniref:Methylosome protein 50-like n=1 Tax=Xenopus laevis TaxID=8355 RepID=A0A8J1M660_XENLA|nr:methylosome protein 50-like [Xenopus laevis]